MRITNESGRSLIEMLGVISLIAVITVSGLAAVNIVSVRYRSATIQSEVGEIIQGVFNLYSFHRNWNKINNADLAVSVCENDLIGRKCTEGGTFKNDFGGEIKVSLTSESNTSDETSETQPKDKKIKIEYTQLPSTVCRYLMCNLEWDSVAISAPSMETGCRCGKRMCSFCPDGKIEFTSW